MIKVTTIDDGDPARFEVTVSDGGESRHEVTVSRTDLARLTPNEESGEQLVEAAFRFLLDREPKESIMSAFDITVISRFFPEFEREIGKYLAG